MIRPVSSPVSQRFNDPCCQATYAQFGMVGHNGIDYASPTGTLVKSAVSGKVTEAFDDGNGYGRHIRIVGEGYETIYGHLASYLVAVGQQVAQGQGIAYSNNTGFSSGPHLHFGVRPIGYNINNGFKGYVDPEPLMKGVSIMIPSADFLNSLFVAYFSRKASQAEVDQFVGKVSYNDLIITMDKSPERQNGGGNNQNADWAALKVLAKKLVA